MEEHQITSRNCKVPNIYVVGLETEVKVYREDKRIYTGLKGTNLPVTNIT